MSSRSPVRIRGKRGRSGSRSPLNDRKNGRGRSDSDFSGRWKGKEESDPYAFKYHYDKSGENEPSRRPRGGGSKRRAFVKGNCRYGESCRFSHDQDDNVRVDPDHGYNSNKNGGQTVGTLKPWNGPLWDEPLKPVKILKWGETVASEVYLSEDVSASRRGDEKWWDVSASRRGEYVFASRRGDEKWGDVSTSRKGVKTWGEPESSILKWGENVVFDVDLSQDVYASRAGDAQWGDVSASRKGDQKWGCSLEDEIKAWEHDKKGLKRDNYHYRTNYENSRHMVATMATVTADSFGEPQQNVISNEFSSHSRIPNHNLGREAGQHYLTAPSGNPQVPMTSNTYQYQGMMPEHNRGPVQSSFPYEQTNWQHSTVQHSSFPVQAPIQQFAPLNTLPMPVSNAQNIDAVHAAKSFFEEYRTQLHSVLEPSTLMTSASSQNLLHTLPTDCPRYVNSSTSGYSKVEGSDTNSRIQADDNFSNRADYQGKEDRKKIMLFKNALAELVKNILSPDWKQGNMSREVYKTVVKNVVDRVSGTVRVEHVSSQEKIKEYMSSNRPHISYIVEAHVEQYLKG